MCKVASDKSDTIQKVPLACADETAAVEFLESLRWADEACCPRCGDCDVYKMTKRGSDERNERFLWRCRGCGKQFTVRIGTVMEESPIPLRHWVFAFWAATASKKGVSALQIKRQTGVTYKTALFMMHRIRWAMGNDPKRPLDGDVEVDETLVGGKPRKRPKGAPTRKPGRQPDYHLKKTQMVAMVERQGDVRTRVRTDVTGENLRKSYARKLPARPASSPTNTSATVGSETSTTVGTRRSRTPSASTPAVTSGRTPPSRSSRSSSAASSGRFTTSAASTCTATPASSNSAGIRAE